MPNKSLLLNKCEEILLNSEKAIWHFVLKRQLMGHASSKARKPTTGTNNLLKVEHASCYSHSYSYKERYNPILSNPVLCLSIMLRDVTYKQICVYTVFCDFIFCNLNQLKSGVWKGPVIKVHIIVYMFNTCLSCTFGFDSAL